MRTNKKSLLIIAACLYIVAAGLYGFWAHHKVSQWSQLRAERIAASPKIHVTAEGNKYHNERHYADRSREISLYEAKELGLEPCKICFRQRIASGLIMEHPIERQAEDIQVLSPLPWPIAHWIASIIGLTVIASAVGLLGPRIAYGTRIGRLSMVTTVPVFILVVWLLYLMIRQIDKLPRYAAGVGIGAIVLFWLWRGRFKLSV